MEYILQKKAGDNVLLPVYYCGNWEDTTRIYRAKRYTLDEAMEQAKTLKAFGGHYIIVRVS